MTKEICCPNCGNRELQVQTETDVRSSGKDFSGSQACCGAFLFGPLGVLCGSCGQNKTVSTTNTTYWNCPKCGKRFIAPDDMRKKIADLEKTFKVLTVIAAVYALLAFVIGFAMLAGEGPIALMFIVMLITAALAFAFLEGIFYLVSKSKAKKMRLELQQLEEDMARFLQQ